MFKGGDTLIPQAWSSSSDQIKFPSILQTKSMLVLCFALRDAHICNVIPVLVPGKEMIS